MRHRHTRWCTASILIACLAASYAAAQARLSLFRPGAIRVLILTGRNNHDWRATTPFMRDVLLKSGRFDVRVCEEPEGITGEMLAAYQAVLVDYCGPRWGSTAEKAVEAFVRSGNGMVVVHGASYTFGGLEVLGDRHVRTGIVEPKWPEYARMVGGYWPGVPPKQFHGRRHSFPVKLKDTSHPILQGMGDSFIATDELYHQMTFLPETRVLAAAFDDPRMGGTGQDEPMLCSVQYGKGRVFYTALGHDLSAMSEAGFQITLARGTEWAATGRVTLPPAVPGRTTENTPARALVVTGGHDYETSFYTLFEGYPDLAWAHAPSAEAAFKADVRSKYDVAVFYDMSQDLSESARRNLRDFTEAGKGIVVLHHALADFPGWDWWSDSVTGGRYLLKPGRNMPASTYKHNEELFVRPAASHPITNPVGPMHVRDETYKGMWISPDVKVLLRTDNPTSDGPVAWISAFAGSRVVCIQLGHDAHAHRHPGYRALVRNAILWSAGRLK